MNEWRRRKRKRRKRKKKQKTYADTAGELNHLLGLDVLEAVDTGNTVSHGEHTTGLVDIDLGNSTENLLLKDGGDLRAVGLGG